MKTPKGLKIGKCSHGIGVIAARDFKKGQLIALVRGGKVKKMKDASMYALKIPGTNLYWDEIDIKKPLWDSFIDHGDVPNAKISFDNFNSKHPRAKLVALHKIEKNEEITIDYRDYGDKLYKAKRYHKIKIKL